MPLHHQTIRQMVQAHDMETIMVAQIVRAAAAVHVKALAHVSPPQIHHRLHHASPAMKRMVANRRRPAVAPISIKIRRTNSSHTPIQKVQVHRRMALICHIHHHTVHMGQSLMHQCSLILRHQFIKQTNDKLQTKNIHLA